MGKVLRKMLKSDQRYELKPREPSVFKGQDFEFSRFICNKAGPPLFQTLLNACDVYCSVLY